MRENRINVSYNSQDIQATLGGIPANVLGDRDDISAVAEMVTNGDISDIWVCRSSTPYSRFAEFESVLSGAEYLYPLDQFYTTVEQMAAYADARAIIDDTVLSDAIEMAKALGLATWSVRQPMPAIAKALGAEIIVSQASQMGRLWAWNRKDQNFYPCHAGTHDDGKITAHRLPAHSGNPDPAYDSPAP